MEKMEIITIPDGEKKIKKSAFRWRRSLYGIIIPESVVTIEKNAFYECYNLQNIIIPDSVTNIEKYAFYGCKKLQTVTMSQNIENIGDYTFYGCKNLTGIYLPESLTSIGNYAFSWCKKITVSCPDTQKLVEAYCKKNKIKLELRPKIPMQYAETEIIPKTEIAADSEITVISDIEVKINEFTDEINLFVNFVNDAAFLGELAEIKNILEKIVISLKEEKDIENRSEKLNHFADYYFPAIKKILNAYRQIENQNIKVGSALETKQKIADSFPFIKKAFEKELEYIYKNKMLDVTTDIDVLESMFAKDGLLDTNPFEL